MPVFATQDAAFADFLQRISGLRENDNDASIAAALVARNFRLEEGVGMLRFESYRAAGAVERLEPPARLSGMRTTGPGNGLMRRT